jgi:ABC-type lipoprotein release transport system permease subunit
MALPLSYNWRNLFVRKLSTALTFIVVAVVVFVLCVLLSFAMGIRASLAASGSADNLIVLKPGATSESTSIILPEEVNRLPQTPGVAHDGQGRPLISQELCVQTSIPRRGPQGTMANVAVRGVEDMAFVLHKEVRLVEGRRFEPGALEVIVGQSARDRYANLELGGKVAIGRLANRECTVVGVFSSGGSALESEIWMSRPMLTDLFGRHFTSSALLRLEDPSQAQATISYINGPAVNLEAKPELDYYHELSKTTREIVVLTTILVGIMAIGAMFAVANTMYAAVDSRRREIAMLRTIGFSRGSIVTAFLIESLLVCVAACAFGLAASLLVNGSKQDFISEATWTVLAYELKITRETVITALLMAGVVAVAGALAPAIRAARTQVIEALRKA